MPAFQVTITPRNRLQKIFDWTTDKMDILLFALVATGAMIVINTFSRFKFFQRFMDEQRRKIRSDHMRDLANIRWDKERARKKEVVSNQQELVLEPTDGGQCDACDQPYSLDEICSVRGDGLGHVKDPID